MQTPKISRDEVAILLLIAAVLFGGVFRLLPIWMADFPINDGGMFFTIIEDLRSNHYIPPLFTTYNNSNIPFAYPPLGFYIGAILTDIFNVSNPIAILQWLPAILNTLCIPAFYLLAKEILEDNLKSSLATLVIALTPHMTAWFSMGGGLTRTLGAVFMLLTLTYAYRALVRENKKAIWQAAIFGTLTALSHTEAPVYTIALAIYFWAAKSRTSKGLLHGLLIAIGVLVLALPWYGWVIHQHGLAPLISASQSGFHSFFAIVRIININYLTEEVYLGIIGVVGILGMASLISENRFFIPGMLAVVFLANPRSAHTIGNFPLAIASAFFISEILIPTIRSLPGKTSASRRLILFCIVLIPFIASNSLYYSFQLSEKRISKGDLSAMQWVAQNTPEDSHFLIITGEQSLFCDSVSEWFPAITKRQSVATLQGQEWTKGKDFKLFLSNAQSVQACLHEGISCIEEKADAFTQEFTHLYVSTHPPTQECNLTNASGLTHSLILELKHAPNFQIILDTADAAIFVRK